MLMTKKCLYMPILAVMFLVLVSCGCGGGGGGSGNTSQSDNLPGWDSLPNPVADNQNNNQNNNNGSTNQNQNQNQNPGTPTNPDTNNQNQDTNTGSDTPVAISGMWEIVSGYGIVSNDVSGKTYVNHLTYAPGKNRAVSITMTKNTYSFPDYYTLELAGDNVVAGVALSVYYTIDEYPNNEARTYPIFAIQVFDYIGNGTYQATDKLIEELTGTKGNAGNFTHTLKLENASTLRWTVWSKMNSLTMNSSDEALYEIVLKKVQ